MQCWGIQGMQLCLLCWRLDEKRLAERASQNSALPGGAQRPLVPDPSADNISHSRASPSAATAALANSRGRQPRAALPTGAAIAALRIMLGIPRHRARFADRARRATPIAPRSTTPPGGAPSRSARANASGSRVMRPLSAPPPAALPHLLLLLLLLLLPAPPPPPPPTHPRRPHAPRPAPYPAGQIRGAPRRPPGLCPVLALEARGARSPPRGTRPTRPPPCATALPRPPPGGARVAAAAEAARRQLQAVPMGVVSSGEPAAIAWKFLVAMPVALSSGDTKRAAR